MIDLWAPLEELLEIWDEERKTKYTLYDFSCILILIKEFTVVYYKNIHNLKKFITPKDQDILLQVVRSLEEAKRSIWRIKKLTPLNFSLALSYLPIQLIEELETNLQGDTMLRSEKDIGYLDFDPKIRKYQRLFRELRLHNEKQI